MTTPYYDRAGVVLYLGDALEVLPALRANSADLLVTDPPYGVSWVSGYRTNSFAEMAGDDSVDVGLAGVAAALRVLTECRHAYVFGRFDLSGLPLSSPVELIWDKGQINGGDLVLPWGPQHEVIQFAMLRRSTAGRERGDGRLAARLRRGSVLRHPRLNATAVTRHPTEKPVALLRELIESSSCIGETVLDPFVGVGSTLVAARLEGRRAIGIEIEERYCEIAARRLDQDVLPLFGEVS